MHKFQASKWFIMCSLNAYYDNKRKTLKYILYSFYFLVFFSARCGALYGCLDFP